LVFKPSAWNPKDGESTMGLSVYFDESGTDSGNSSLIVAGFGATIEQWDRFSDEWLQAQADFRAPCFHAKEFDDARRGFGPYADWSKAKRDEYLNRLLGIIIRRTFMSFGTILEKDAYDAVIAPHPARRKYFYAPYAFAAFNCIFETCDWRNEYHAGKVITFFFDKGHKNEGQLLEVAQRVLIGKDRLVQDLVSADDQFLPPLQAADLLAFELCAEARALLAAANRYSRYPLARLDEHPHEWLFIDTDGLTERVAKLTRDGVLPEA